jgi:hypothetical protein
MEMYLMNDGTFVADTLLKPYYTRFYKGNYLYKKLTFQNNTFEIRLEGNNTLTIKDIHIKNINDTKKINLLLIKNDIIIDGNYNLDELVEYFIKTKTDSQYNSSVVFYSTENILDYLFS